MNTMNGTTELTAELSCGSAPALIFAKQGDEDSRYVSVRFLFAGKDFPLGEAAHTEIRIQKPDGTVTVNDGSIGEDGTAVYPLSPQSLTAAGEGKADFLLFGENDELISTVPARLVITPAPVGDEAIESISEYRAFVRDITDIKSAIIILQQTDGELARDLNSVNTSLGRAIASLNDRLGNLSFMALTESEYAALDPKDPDTLYIVTADEEVGE